jgi:hypothetical protein
MPSAIDSRDVKIRTIPPVRQNVLQPYATHSEYSELFLEDVMDNVTCACTSKMSPLIEVATTALKEIPTILIEHIKPLSVL